MTLVQSLAEHTIKRLYKYAEKKFYYFYGFTQLIALFCDIIHISYIITIIYENFLLIKTFLFLLIENKNIFIPL